MKGVGNVSQRKAEITSEMHTIMASLRLWVWQPTINQAWQPTIDGSLRLWVGSLRL